MMEIAVSNGTGGGSGGSGGSGDTAEPSASAGSADSSAAPRQAVLLAAGMGTRLGPHTADVPKCLVPVGGRTILERAVERLAAVGIAQLLVVTGYKGELIREFLHRLDSPVRFEFVHNADYATTNNIHSFWLAAGWLRPPFILLESDLLFGPRLLPDLMNPCAAAVGPLEAGMNGTVVTLDAGGRVDGMYLKKDPRPAGRDLYKTINIYSFDGPAWHEVLRPRFKAAAEGKITDCYYEAIFARAIADGELNLRGAVHPAEHWHEIDTPEDLEGAEKSG
jgi:choline kinase